MFGKARAAASSLQGIWGFQNDPLPTYLWYPFPAAASAWSVGRKGAKVEQAWKSGSLLSRAPV